MKTALEVTGIKVLDVELARITEECDPPTFEPAFELGAEIGAKHMIMSAWTQDRHDRSFLIDCYAETCEIAHNYGLTVDLEFPSFSRLRTLDEVLDIVRAADQPNSGILVDTLYVHLSRVDLGELLHVPAELLHFLHVSDALPGIADTREGMIQLARDARLYPGEGCIDFAGVVERMPPVYYSIELPNQSRVRELGYEEHARRCLQHARAVMGEAQSRRLPVSLDLSPSASSSTRSSHLESLHA
jgi:sugar phosphate isomerase/epimerase